MNRTMTMKTPVIRQRGVALIEVLVVFFVLSIGLLGMAALQMRAMQFGQSSYMRSQATVAANDMMDRIRLNRGVVPAAELLAWQNEVTGLLPVTVQPTANCAASLCTITITWKDRTDQQNPNATETVTVVSRM